MAQPNRPYTAKNWESGDIITSAKLNDIESVIASIDDEITGARNYGNNTSGTLGARIDELVQISNTQPGGNNEIWINSNSNTIVETQVPTYSEFEALKDSIAQEYSESALYSIGDYVIHEEQLYQCTTEITTAETWTAAHWTQVVFGNEIRDLKSAIRPVSAYNFLMDFTPSSAGSANVTFTPVYDGGVKVVGTAGGSGSFYNYYVETTGGLPAFMKPGKKYYVNYSSTNVDFCVWFYKNGSYYTGLQRKTNGEFTVPADASGCIIRLLVASETTVNNEIVYPVIVECFTNQELTNIVNDLENSIDDLADNLVDDTLSEEGKAADAKVTGSMLNDVKSAIRPVSAYNFLMDFTPSVAGSPNVTFTPVYDGGVKVQGTAGGNGSFYNYYFGRTAGLPTFMKPGKTYFVQYSSTNVTFSVWFYKNNSSHGGLERKTSGEFTVPTDADGCIIRLIVASGTTVDETVYPVIVECLTNQEITNLLNEELLYGDEVTGSGNPVILHGVKAANKIKEISISGAVSGDIISISGKNIYFTGSDMQQCVNNGVTYQFANQQIAVSSQGATGTSISSGDNFNTKYQMVNGKLWWHNYKFMVSHDTVVTVSLNASVELLYDSLIQGQISDGTTMLCVDGNGLTFVAKAGTEYGFRLVAYSGFSGSVTFKPQIEFSAYETAYERFSGLRGTISGNGTFYNSPYTVQEGTTVVFIHNGTAEFTITVDGMDTKEKASSGNAGAEKLDALTFGKTLFAKPRKALISFIDDDTSSVAFVRRYHDIFAAKNVVGGYAVMTKNLDSQEGLAQLLLDYEQEGFSCLYHCYDQNGNATRYWESGNEAYDEAEIKENFMRGLRDMQEYGFSAYKYWVTPYGVGDDFIQSLAKTHDLPCLFVMGGNIVENSFVTISGNCNRYGIPRISVSTLSNQSRTKQIIDACIAAKGWLTIVTHANTWESDTTMDDKLAEIVQYCIDGGAEIVSVPEAFNEYKPYFYWSELLS